MSDRENEPMPHEELMLSVERFEQMIKQKDAYFFDQYILENLIDYYEEESHLKMALQVADVGIEQHPYSTLFYTRKADIFIYQKKYKQAEELLDKAELLDPHELDIYFLRSDIKVYTHKLTDAIDILKQAMNLADKDDLEFVWLEMADVYEEWERIHKVMECLANVLELNPDNEEALYRLWFCMDWGKLYNETVQLMTRTINERPYNYLAWYNLGLAYVGLNLYEKALEAFDYCIVIDENNDLAYRDSGDAHFFLKQYEQAIEFYKKAIEVSKPYEDLYFDIGLCYEKLKDYTKARNFYRKAVSTDTGMDKAYYRIAITYTQERLWENALRTIKKALRNDRRQFDYWILQAQCYYELGMINELGDTVNHIMQLSVNWQRKSKFTRLFVWMCDLEMRQKAGEWVDFLSKEFKEKPEVLLMRAAFSFIQGWRKKALVLLELALVKGCKNTRLIFTIIPALLNDIEVMQLIQIYSK